ncbi:hypothetical protein [Salinisphaera sp. LB1]|uniref:hypothetical protein n=1 Tax=Salinisphaera sp. LB1 TaxID=2183911 RepID=UPI000D70789D|nr:hypothetical protein [Salinisphaera sp. LB1]AWN16259.1 hypothetical protein SALB1_2061 [Salinisphaera sp. LB1]
MWRRTLVVASMLTGLAGCASQPSSPIQDAYNDYWTCASNAVRPFIDQRDLTSHEAALRAQAQCNPSYRKYRAAQIAAVRHTVPADSYDMADPLGAQQALVWRRRVTKALDDYVQRVRAGS